MELINSTPYKFANLVGRINFPHNSLTMIVKATFDLKPNEKAQFSEEQLFPTGDEFAPEDEEQTGSVLYDADFAYFKPQADLLLVGKCYAPGGQASTHTHVTFQVGEKRRILNVYGNRYWKHTIGSGSISEPERFLEIPVNYENAFGGENHYKNPIGKGASKGKLLPNIEDPNYLINSPGDQPEPAGFGPLSRKWELRNSKLGTYKTDYLKTRWPWFAEDFDWSHFNAAPTEMQMADYLKGDEKLYFENLHSTHSQYEAQLPGERMRCFMRSVDPENNQPFFKEVTMNLDTLWVNMEEEKLVLMWRGWNDVLSDEFEEISHIFVMAEPVEQAPASAEQAHKLFAEKRAEIDKEWSIKPELAEEVKDEVVKDSTKESAEVALEEVIASEVKVPPISAKELEKQVNKALSQIGIDVGNLPPEAKKQMQQQQEKMLNKIAQSDSAKAIELEGQELQNQLKEELTKLDLDLDNLPPVSEKAKLEQLRFMKELGVEDAALEEGKELKQLWEVTSAVLPKMGLNPEDLTPLLEHAKKHKDKLGLESLSDEEKTELERIAELKAEKRAQLKSRAENTESFVGEDFSGLDLSDLDLKDLDFTGALFVGSKLENTDFSGSTLIEAKFVAANLKNAKLNNTISNNADFSNADLSSAECKAATLCSAIIVNAKINSAKLSESDLSFANFSDSELNNSELDKVNLSNGLLTNAVLNKINLAGADLSDANFEKVQMVDANLGQVKAVDAYFVGGEFSKSRFVEADLSKADFSGATLIDANFQGALLADATMEKVSAANICLAQAKLAGLRASEGSDFSNALLEQADGKESIWHNAKLDGADFNFAVMHGADFAKASLTKTNCFGADMRFCRFIKADLSGAQMLDMNLFKGSLEKANLTQANFSGSNLYGVEFLDAKLKNTIIGGANLKGTKLQEAV